MREIKMLEGEWLNFRGIAHFLEPNFQVLCGPKFLSGGALPVPQFRQQFLQEAEGLF